MVRITGLSTVSLKTLDWGDSVTRVLETALQAVDPATAVHRWMGVQDNILNVNGREYPLRNYTRIFCIGIGKAAVPMGSAVAGILGSRLTAGILLTKEGYAKNLTGDETLAGFTKIEAGHPLPDARGLHGAYQISDLLSKIGENDLIIFLISGGGSALMPSPAAGITLGDLQVLTTALLACGATINEINILRKHLDTLKGGGLARLAVPASIITLVLSDVIGDPLDVIASGPSVPDPTTFLDAITILQRYGIVGKIPPSIIHHLQKGVEGKIPDTPKPYDPLFNRVQNVMIGSNRQAVEAAKDQAKREGFMPLLLTTFMQGEASQVGRMLVAITREIIASGNPISRPACLLAGGETTVTIRGNGMGGRNQELALSAVEGMKGIEGVVLVSLATDGGDGPTDSAGAVVTGETMDRAHKMGLSPAAYLANNDAYHFFDTLGDLLKPGPTQTNVNDLVTVFIK